MLQISKLKCGEVKLPKALLVMKSQSWDVSTGCLTPEPLLDHWGRLFLCRAKPYTNVPLTVPSGALQPRAESGSGRTVGGRPCGMSATKEAVCCFAFVGSGVAAEKGVINTVNVTVCFSASGIWRIVLTLEVSDSFWPIKWRVGSGDSTCELALASSVTGKHAAHRAGGHLSQRLPGPTVALQEQETKNFKLLRC